MRMRHAAVVAGLALGLMSGTAKAAYVVDIYQDGSNVVASGSGSIDTSGLTFLGNSNTSIAISPHQAFVTLGSQKISVYEGIFGPSSLGPGGSDYASSSTGNGVGLFGSDSGIFVPQTYKSGSELGVSTAVFSNRTIAGLGLDIGVFRYSFLTGNEGIDTFTVNVGVSPVPLPASAPMLGAALLALGAVGYGMKRNKAASA